MDITLLNNISKNTLASHLEIEFTGAGDDWLTATMPVNEKTRQPFGYLHGGASLALAETVASTGSWALTDPDKQQVFGIQVSGNHISAAREGIVTATARIIHKGKQTHTWDVTITNEKGKKVSLCRVTNMIVKKKQ